MGKNLFLLILFSLINIVAINSQCYPDRHSTNYFDGWKSCQQTQSPNLDRGIGHWIQYELDIPLRLHEFHFWNLNDPDDLETGINTYAIDISENGIDYIESGQYTLEIGSGSPYYEGIEGPNLDGKLAKYILITALSTFDSNFNCAGFSEIKITTSEVNVPLEILSFDYRCEDSYTKLSWDLTNSVNQENIVLERSFDQENWIEIFHTKAQASNPGIILSFEYLDKNNAEANNFYRLKIIDFDGNIEYSRRIVSMCKPFTNRIQVFPIPTSQAITVESKQEFESIIEVEIRDISGLNRKNDKLYLLPGTKTFTLDVQDLNNGIYVIIINQKNNSSQKKFIVSK